MHEHHVTTYDRYVYADPDPSQGMFPTPAPRKITRSTTKTKDHGKPGSRSRNEREARRMKRAARRMNRR